MLFASLPLSTSHFKLLNPPHPIHKCSYLLPRSSPHISQRDEGVCSLGLFCFESLARRLAGQRDVLSWQKLLGRALALLEQGVAATMAQVRG